MEPATEQQLAELTRGDDQSQSQLQRPFEERKRLADGHQYGADAAGGTVHHARSSEFTVKAGFSQSAQILRYRSGSGFGFGLPNCGGLELMDDRLHSEKEIKALLPIAVLSEIPDIISPLDEAKTKRRLAFAWTMTALVVVTIAAGSAFSYFHS